MNTSEEQNYFTNNMFFMSILPSNWTRAMPALLPPNNGGQVSGQTAGKQSACLIGRFIGIRSFTALEKQIPSRNSME